MSNEAAGPWPSWDELFGSPPGTPPGDGTPSPFTPPTRDDMPDYLRDRFSGGAGLGMYESRPDDTLGWNVGGQPDRAPAPDPLMAPAGMVANPYYYLPGNAAYIPQAQYDTLMADQDPRNFGYVDGSMVARPRFDAYDATLQTYGDPAKLGYDPGGAWQRENDYYDALASTSNLSRGSGGGGYTEKVTKTKDGIIVEIRPIPRYYDMRQGEYYQPDGTIAANNNLYPPTEPIFVGITNEELKYIPAGMSYADYALTRDVSRSQPRANPLGGQSLLGSPGGIVTKDTPDLRARDEDPTTTPAYDYLRGISPSQIKLTDGTITTDPNPFRGNVGTTTAFTAEEGDRADMYPGVSFYEAGSDGTFKKVTSLTPGKDYYAVRENYDYTGFPVNTQMFKGGAGDAFTVRMGDGGDVNIDSVDEEFSVTSVTYIDPITGDRVRASSQDIRDGKYGEPGVIPAGATVVLTKKASQWETPADNPRADAVYDDAAGTYIDPNNGRMWLNDGTPGGTWVEPEDYNAAKKKEPYWDERYQAYVDPASNKVWRNAQEGWVPKPPIANDNLEQPPADDKGKPVETPKPEPLPPQIDEWIYSINAMKDNPYERGKSYYEIPVPSTLLGTSSDDWPLYVDIVELTTTSDGKPTTRIVKAGETLQAGKSYVIRVTKSDLTNAAKNPPKGKK